jgi:exonuclease SbcC
VATGVGEVTRYLQSKLGMSRQEFFNTYFTGQKELKFLSQVGPAERGRFLAQVLGYERLRRAQTIARERRNALESEIRGLTTGLADPDALKEQRVAANARLKEAGKSFARAQKQREKLEKEVAAATPLWQAAQAARENAQRLTIELESARRELDQTQREVERTVAELTRIDEAERQLAALQPKLAELAEVKKRAEELEDISRAYARASALRQNEAKVVGEIKKLDQVLEGLKQAPAILIQTQDELKVLHDEVTADVFSQKKLNVRSVLRLGLASRKYRTMRTQLRLLIERFSGTGRSDISSSCKTLLCGARACASWPRLYSKAVVRRLNTNK